MQYVVISESIYEYTLHRRTIAAYLMRKRVPFREEVDNGELNGNYYESTFYLNPGQPDEKSFSEYDIPRDDPVLVSLCRERNGDILDSEGGLARIVEVPDGVDWYVDDVGGDVSCEVVRERHRIFSHKMTSDTPSDIAHTTTDTTTRQFSNLDGYIK